MTNKCSWSCKCDADTTHFLSTNPKGEYIWNDTSKVSQSSVVYYVAENYWFMPQKLIRKKGPSWTKDVLIKYVQYMELIQLQITI